MPQHYSWKGSERAPASDSVALLIEPWRTIEQEAARVQCCEATLRRACKRGDLRHARVGGGRRSIRLRPSWTDAYLEKQGAPIKVSDV